MPSHSSANKWFSELSMLNYPEEGKSSVRAHYLSQMWPLEQTACLRSVKGRISLHKLQCSGKVCLFIFFRMCPISTWNTQEALTDTAQGGNTSL